MSSSSPVQSLDTVRMRLIALNDDTGLSWREIAKMDDFKGIPPGTLCAIAKGREPMKPEHRRILNLADVSVVLHLRDPKTGRFVKYERR